MAKTFFCFLRPYTELNHSDAKFTSLTPLSNSLGACNKSVKPKHPSHVRFLNKIRKHCGRHNVFIEFSASKTLNTGEGERVYGYFQPPHKGESGLIRVATGEGWNQAMYFLAHEASHMLSWLKSPKRWVYQVLSGNVDHYIKEEIFAESHGLKLLRRHKVKVDLRKVAPSVKRYIRDIRALRD